MVRAMKKIEENLNPPIILQEKLTLSQFSDYLNDLILDDANELTQAKELKNYLAEDFKRFCYTFSLLPEIDQEKKLLEIGGNPYYLTALMKKYTNYEIICTNCFNDDDSRYYESLQTLSEKRGEGKNIYSMD